MFRTAFVFLALAVIAAILGSGGLILPDTSIATLLFYLYLAGFVVALLLGLITGRRTTA